jgi:hypothetical protein
MKINLVSIHIKDSPLSMPLAAGILKSELLSDPEIRNRAEVTISDYFQNDDVNKIADGIISEKPDVVGLSVYLWNTGKVFRVSRLLKEINPKIIIIAGGAEPTSNPGLF